MLLNIAVALSAVIAASYIHFRPALSALGVGRVIQPVGNINCKTVPQLQACEKLVLHRPAGLIYLACSTPHSRIQWTPALDRLNASGRSELDYVATYDPDTGIINRLTFSAPTPVQGISLHGMDVVPSVEDSSLLYVYLVNHRKPNESADSTKVGANSSIEVFKTYVGSSTLEHVRTFQDPAIVVTPNDVVGSSDGKSIHFTNDHKHKTGIGRVVSLLALRADTSIGFCHADQGCKFAYTGLRASNGIVKGCNDTFYVADCVLGGVTVLERQSDDTFALVETIKTDRSLDNLAIDANGALWAAGLPDTLGMASRLINDPSVLLPSSALRITANSGPGSFYGEKYNVEKVFEDPGELASGSTSVVYDVGRGLLFVHGLVSPHLTICRL